MSSVLDHPLGLWWGGSSTIDWLESGFPYQVQVRFSVDVKGFIFAAALQYTIKSIIIYCIMQ